MVAPNINKKMPTKGGYETRRGESYVHGGPSGSELPPVLSCVRCKCGAVPVRVDGVLKLDCGCRRGA